MGESADKRAAWLRDELTRHNHLYYIEAKPAISDREFDQLMQELIELESAHPDLRSPDSPTQRVGGEAIEGFASVQHAVPMISIDNTYNQDEVREFDRRVRKGLGIASEPAAAPLFASTTPADAPPSPIRYVLEPKIDGTAVSLRYEQGVLVLAATRGRGNVGDDITHNARTIGSIPLKLRHETTPVPDIVEVRGEIFMDNTEFQRVNRELEAAGEETYANPRNLTAGTLKRLDPKIVAQRRLSFLAHGLGQVQPLPVATYWQWLDLLRAWGLPVAANVQRVEGVEAAIAAIEQFATVRKSLPFMTDGMVMKVDDFAQRDRLGATSKAPRWVIAYKYETEQQPAKLLDVKWQVGKGGNLTPVGHLEPTFIGGVTVSRVTLHNIEQIQRLDLHHHDTVIVERAGEVIPYVVQVVKDRRVPGAGPIQAPAQCPCCGAAVIKEEGTPILRCPNPQCPDQFKERLRWFCARGQMDIEEVGEKLVEQLVDRKLVTQFADLYRLTRDELLELDRMGEKSAQNILDAVAASKQRPLDRLLGGLGIRHVGSRVAHVLARQFGSLDVLAAAAESEFSSTHEIGPVIAHSVHEFFHQPTTLDLVKQLQAVGVDPKVDRAAAPDESTMVFKGKTIVVTGTLPTLQRQQIEELIVKLGGKASGSVSKKTSFLVAGADAGSKLEKARALGVEVIDEAQFKLRAGI